MKNSIFIVFGTLLCLAACSHHPPKPLALVTIDELAHLEKSTHGAPGEPLPEGLKLQAPLSSVDYASQESVDDKGPQINILQPSLSSVVSNPMSVQVEFSSRQPNARVNMDSLKLTYKKLWGIDLTDRIIEYIEGDSINAPEVELPEGTHTLEIYIEDTDENVSIKLITVEVAES